MLQIIGLVVVVIFGIYLCLLGGFVAFAGAFYGGDRLDKLAGLVVLGIGILIVSWTLYENISVQVGS